MDNRNRVVGVLAGSDAYLEFQKAFECATGFKVHIESAKPIISPRFGNGAEFNSSLMRELNLMENLNLFHFDWGEGISELIVPIKIGGQVIGLLRTGCVMEKKITEQKLLEIFGLRRTGTKRFAYTGKFPVVSRQKLAALGRLLCVFGNHLSHISNQLMLQQSNCEPAIITKAKQYIKDNHHESLLLKEVAANSHVSPFYLCKLFKKITGLNFSEYLSRTRIETAKELLLDDNRKISDAALEAGFQSLTHFNRVFKRLVGNSPRDFRKTSCQMVQKGDLHQLKRSYNN